MESRPGLWTKHNRNQRDKSPSFRAAPTEGLAPVRKGMRRCPIRWRRQIGRVTLPPEWSTPRLVAGLAVGSSELTRDEKTTSTTERLWAAVFTSSLLIRRWSRCAHPRCLPSCVFCRCRRGMMLHWHLATSWWGPDLGPTSMLLRQISPFYWTRHRAPARRLHYGAKTGAAAPASEKSIKLTNITISLPTSLFVRDHITTG